MKADKKNQKIVNNINSKIVNKNVINEKLFNL